MKNILVFVLSIATAITFAACETPPATNAPATNGNTANTANANAAKPAAAPPTKEAVLALEKSAHDAFKNKDAKFWETFLTNNFVGYGEGGRLDRAAAMKAYAGADCDIKSTTLSEENMTAYGTDAAIITAKVTTDGTCGGKKLPAESWSATAYVRDGDKWKAAFHAQAEVVDPKAAPAKPAAAAPAKQDEPAAPPAADALTTALLANENKGWEAWKNRDAKTLNEIGTSNFQYLSSAGLKNKEESTKVWTEPKCDIKSFSLSDPKSVSLTKDFALITYKGSATGTCDGKPVPPAVWVASFNMKEGETWKNAFYMDVLP
jgi:hypothetical protein